MYIAEEIFNPSTSKDPLICFVHPIGTSKKIWEPVTKHMLKTNYTVSTIDLPGHGDSGYLDGNFTLEGAADTLIKHLQEKNRNVVLVGHSIGGMVAQITASRQPKFLKGLVLVSTLAQPPSDEVKEAMKERGLKVLKEGMQSIITSTIERWFTPENIQDELPEISLVSNLLSNTNPEIHAQAWNAISEFNSIPLLPEITVPTLILVGELDVSTPPFVAKVIEEHCPNSKLKVIPKAGHALPQEEPEAFIKSIITFMEEIKVEKQSTIQFEAAGKIVSIINCFCDDSPEWGVRELGTHLGLPKSNVHRILKSLTELGWLEFDEEYKRYKVGMELYRISSNLSQKIPIVKMARPCLEALANETGEASILCIYNKELKSVIFQDLVQSSHSLRYSLPLGIPNELYSGATGRSIMAFLPENDQLQIMENLLPLTDNTLIDKKELSTELLKTRELGFAISFSERIPGAVSVAAPFFKGNSVVGSIALTIPKYRIGDPEQLNSWSKLVLHEAKNLTHKLGST